MERRTRRKRTASLNLESLESRQLLSGKARVPYGLAPTYQYGSAQLPIAKYNQISYKLSGGERVIVSLIGPGSLKGTTQDADGTLHLVFRNTDKNSAIVGRVLGGSGRAPLGSVLPANLVNTPGSQVGSGAPAIALINLHRFDLVNRGTINLLGGIGAMFLGSAGPNTQIYMKQGPISPILNSLTRSGVITTDSTGKQIIQPTTVGTTLAGGTTFAGEAVIPADAATSTPPKATFQGIDFQISQVNAEPAPDGGPRLQGPQIYAAQYDSAAQTASLLRYKYDVKPQTATLVAGPIAIPGPVTTPPEVGLAWNKNQLLALVGTGTTVYAYDALNPTTPVGQFSTAGLAGGARIMGVGSSAVATVLAFDTPLDPTTDTRGSLFKIDVTQSLATGTVKALGGAFQPVRGLDVTGGLTGASVSDAVLTVGAARFDTFTPDQYYAGFVAARASGNRPSEAARRQITNPPGSAITNAEPTSAPFQVFQALGSVEQNVVLVTATQAAAGGGFTNTVAVYNAATATAGFTGTTTLASAAPITGLSESFHPELVGASVIDVQGNLRTFRSDSVRGLVLNDNGQLGKLTIGKISQSTVVARPLSHVDIYERGENVNLISTPIREGDRGGVTVVSKDALRPFGPLVIPIRKLPPTIKS